MLAIAFGQYHTRPYPGKSPYWSVVCQHCNGFARMKIPPALREMMTNRSTLPVDTLVDSGHRLHFKVGKCHASLMFRARGFRTTEIQDFLRSCGILIFTIQLIVAQVGNIFEAIRLQHETHGHNVVMCFTTIRVGRPICYRNLLHNGCVDQACSGPFHGNQIAFHLGIIPSKPCCVDES